MKRLALPVAVTAAILVVLATVLWHAAHPAGIDAAQARSLCSAHPDTHRPITVRGLMEFGAVKNPAGSQYMMGEVCSKDARFRGGQACVWAYTNRPGLSLPSGLWKEQSPEVIMRGELLCRASQYQYPFLPAVTSVSSVSQPGPLDGGWAW
jgi:hypothetical protein